MAIYVATSSQFDWGTAWTGTAPGPGNPTPSGTISSSTSFADHVRKIEFGGKAEDIDFTTFGDGGFVVKKPGLLSADLSVEFNQDYASSSVDATFAAAFLAKTEGYIDIKATSASRGATNPSIVAKAYVNAYPVSQQIGQGGIITVSFTVTGTFARLTS